MENLTAYRSQLLNDWIRRKGSLWFAGKQLPYEAATTHFCYVGATGSGKTISQRMLWQSTLAPTIGHNMSHRCLAFDAKGDLHRIFIGMGIPLDCLKTLNPFDRRSSSWNMAADITDEATACETSNILIPNVDEQQPFFRNAGRDILTGVIFSLILTCQLTGQRWRLSDVIYPLFRSNSELLKLVLAQHPETEDRLQYFHNRETVENIISTIRALMRPFQTIAALWDQAEREGEEERRNLSGSENPRLVSLESWAKDRRGEILILGNSQRLQQSLRLINHVIFKRASQILLSFPELQRDKARRSWVCADEVRELERLDGLQNILTQGRSKGVCCALGFQSIEGMRAVWGEHLAHEITGQCRNRAFFGVADEATAKWAAGNFGEIELMETSKTVSTGRSKRNLDLIQAVKTRSESETEHKVKSSVVLDNELLSLPPTDEENGLNGYYVSPSFFNLGHNSPFQKVQIPADEMFGALSPLSPESDGFDASIRPSAHQRSSGVTEESFCKRFGLPLETLRSRPRQQDGSDRIKTADEILGAAKRR